jgi:DNA-directed RNA polymerase specialized sigma24 family protein
VSHAQDDIAGLFEHEGRALRALAGRLLSPSDAEDLVQDGFLLLLRRGARGVDWPGACD